MIDRKKKLRFYQTIFFIFGLIIILFTYLQKDKINSERILSDELRKKYEDQLQKGNINSDNVFYNVKYSGLDLEGNRYIIISKEAVNSEKDLNIVEMKGVQATFYFKDNTVLYITSLEGNYNNKSLDMEFRKNIEALYENSKLNAEKAVFSNSNNSLIVSKSVKVTDPKGTMFADKLMFDTKDKTLNISSSSDNMVKSIINYK